MRQGRTASDTTAPRSRRPRFRLLFLAVLLLLLGLFAEAMAWTGWWLLTGQPFTWRAGDDARAAAAAGEGAAPGVDQEMLQAHRAANAGAVLHPYLGFVYDPAAGVYPGRPDVPITRYGFLDTDQPVRRRSPDRYIIAVTGGSVALQCALLADDVLVEELGKSRRLAGRRIELVRLALGGFKQPQHVLALQYVWLLGGEFDCVVNLDGFNEVALVMENLPHGVPAWYPRAWARLMEFWQTPEQQLRLGRLAWLRSERRQTAASAAALRWSAAAQLLWLVRDRRLAAAVADAAEAVEHYVAPERPAAVVGPGIGDQTEAAARREMADIWLRGSLQIQQLCAARGIPYFHFLQPNQYVPGSKPIGRLERSVAIAERHRYRIGVEQGYPMLAERFAALRMAGVRFTDLRDLYRDHPEPLYVDTCCHLNQDGNRIMARRIAATIRRDLDLGDVALTGLRVEPDVLRFDAPTATRSFTVHATADDGTEYEVTEPAFGTVAVVDDAAVARISGVGELAPLRRGQTTLRVRLRGREAAVPVTADWPGLITGGDSFATAGQADPVLTLPEGPPAATADRVLLRCAGVPAATHGVLVLALRPIPAAIPDANAVPEGTMTFPLVGAPDGDWADVWVPLPTAPESRTVPLHLRALFVPLGERRIAAASNSLILTRG